MAHNEYIISQVKLPGSEQIYQIHDEHAIHDISELGVSGALVFKGTVAAVSDLPAAAANNQGHVYLVSGENLEYVCIEKGEGYAWEPLGNVHDAASSTHTHNITVSGGNSASAVEVEVAVPTVEASTGSLTATATAPAIEVTTEDTLAAGAKFNTTINGEVVTDVTPSFGAYTATAAGVTVAGDGTAKAITGFGAHPTSDFVTDVTSTNATVVGDISKGTAKAITSVTDTKTNVLTGLGTPTSGAFATGVAVDGTAEAITDLNTTKVTGADFITEGSAASWTANVVNGTLTFGWTANTPTAATTAEKTFVTGSKATAAVATGVKVSSTANAITDLGTPTGTEVVSSVSIGDGEFINAVSSIPATVIGSINFDESAALVGLGTPVTADVLTGVKVTAQPNVTLTKIAGNDFVTDVDVKKDGITATTTADANNGVVKAVTSVTAAAPTVTVNGTVVTGVTVGEKMATGTGTAAAQTWTGSASASQPVEG